MKRLAVAGIAALIVSMAAPAEAAIRERSLEIGPYLVFPSFDDDSNIDNDVGLGARFGIVFEEQHELEFSFDFVDSEDELGFGLDVELTTFKIGYVYNIAPRSPVSPLLTVGAGLQTLEITEETCFGCIILIEEETDPLAYGGIGVRLFAGPAFHVRLDGQAQAVFADDAGGGDETLVDFLFMAGVGWVFGGH